ncbi:hypothetical protein OIU84_020268 [Salix udensis]|uniref:Uncharacterized protein n=1 Tax=Salix udensis TaxID=889485 RepID=A0AAD6J6W5_9ROSI|nr:hypothetical protein OIU84_020268 [Salix udensis]
MPGIGPDRPDQTKEKTDQEPRPRPDQTDKKAQTETKDPDQGPRPKPKPNQTKAQTRPRPKRLCAQDLLIYCIAEVAPSISSKVGTITQAIVEFFQGDPGCVAKGWDDYLQQKKPKTIVQLSPKTC